VSWINETWGRLPIRSWCDDLETKAARQAANLANHPEVWRHVALMPDCHVGFGMPIGGVVACRDAVIPNAVGVDIGCGMVAVQTSAPAAAMTPDLVRDILHDLKRTVPVGEGHAHRQPQPWSGFEAYDASPDWRDARAWDLATRNLGTLGGGNHFLELQAGEDGRIWFMVHSGSRNLGLRIANHHHSVAQHLNARMKVDLPDRDLAYLPSESEEGLAYIRDMGFALRYARENRRRMMVCFEEAVAAHVPGVRFEREINIHHNYAARETHFGRPVWVHRKGATSARRDEPGIIPGSMGAPSFVVRGLGNPESFESCSHGAGRAMGRLEACRTLRREECDAAMRGIVFDGWRRLGMDGRHRDLAGKFDLEEAPAAYKPIEAVMAAQRDLVEPVVRLRPLGVVKG
jgi:tRNA-splicing ligase RtcB